MGTELPSSGKGVSSKETNDINKQISDLESAIKKLQVEIVEMCNNVNKTISKKSKPKLSSGTIPIYANSSSQHDKSFGHTVAPLTKHPEPKYESELVPKFSKATAGLISSIMPSMKSSDNFLFDAIESENSDENYIRVNAIPPLVPLVPLQMKYESSALPTGIENKPLYSVVFPALETISSPKIDTSECCIGHENTNMMCRFCEKDKSTSQILFSEYNDSVKLFEPAKQPSGRIQSNGVSKTKVKVKSSGSIPHSSTKPSRTSLKTSLKKVDGVTTEKLEKLDKLRLSKSDSRGIRQSSGKREDVRFAKSLQVIDMKLEKAAKADLTSALNQFVIKDKTVVSAAPSVTALPEVQRNLSSLWGDDDKPWFEDECPSDEEDDFVLAPDEHTDAIDAFEEDFEIADDFINSD